MRHVSYLEAKFPAELADNRNGRNLKMTNEGNSGFSKMIAKESGVFVYQGEPVEVAIPDLLDQQREERIRELANFESE